MPDPTTVAAVFSDGGVRNRNPSPRGGSWAWCHVSAADECVAEAVGLVTPGDVGLPTVSNNLTELLALLHGLEALPDGWAGPVYTDSYVTLCRFRPGAKKFNGIPDAMVERVRRVVARLGPIHLVLLGGHPNKAALACGKRADGLPVSKWNVHCDELCAAAMAEPEPAVTGN